nr:heme biosynthesis HemY N-terminal domain-containing protein [Pseudomarimonas arenosa]
MVALSVLGAFGWHWLSVDPGYVLITLHGWALETSLAVALALAVLALALLYVLIKLLRYPFRRWRRRRQRKARERVLEGIQASIEGRWERADRAFAKAAREREHAPTALLLAAQNAHAAGANESALRYLDKARRAGAESGFVIVECQRLLGEGRAEEALALLDSSTAAGSPRALELRVFALIGVGRADDAQLVLPSLRKSQLREGESLIELEREVSMAIISQADSGEQALLRWQALPKAQRRDPAIAVALARRGIALAQSQSMADPIEDLLDKQWNEELAGLYGFLQAREPRKAIKRAERWLEAHPLSHGLLLSLGELCRREQLWGKSQDFLNRARDHESIALWECFAALWIDRGDHARAQQALQNALRLSRGESSQPVRALLPAAQEAVVLEQRGSMGMPLLPKEPTSREFRWD